MNERITHGAGKHLVWFEQTRIGDDILILVGGGELPHIGGVVMKVPGEEIRVLTIGIHKDHHVLIPIAEAAARKYDTTVVVTGGVHIDDATKEDIALIMKNCKALHEKL